MTEFRKGPYEIQQILPDGRFILAEIPSAKRDFITSWVIGDPHQTINGLRFLEEIEREKEEYINRIPKVQ